MVWFLLKMPRVKSCFSMLQIRVIIAFARLMLQTKWSLHWQDGEGLQILVTLMQIPVLWSILMPQENSQLMPMGQHFMYPIQVIAAFALSILQLVQLLHLLVHRQILLQQQCALTKQVILIQTIMVMALPRVFLQCWLESPFMEQTYLLLILWQTVFVW